ncbi:ABC transporter permease [Dellaglioa sp. BT-FLS60]
MIKIFKQEIFKLYHRKSVRYVPVFLFILMLLIAVINKNGSNKDKAFYIASAFAGYEWLAIIIITMSASIVSMEFQYGTIRKLISESHNRFEIYLAKWSLMIFYSIFLHILLVIYTIILKVLFYGNGVSLFSKYLYGHSIIGNLLINMSVDMISSIFLISITFMLALLTSTGAVAIAVGLGICFIGEGLSNTLIRSIFNQFHFIKWNPFNMMNITGQWGNPDYFDITKLTLNQLVYGNVGYIIIFIMGGLLIFDRKKI